MNMAQRLGDFAEGALLRQRGAQFASLLAAQHVEVDFPHQRRAKQRGLQRIAQRIQQPRHRTLHRLIERRGNHSGRLVRDRCARLLHLQQQLRRYRQIEMHIDRQQRRLGAGVGLHDKRHRHRDRQIVLRVVAIDAIAEIAALAALQHDHDAGIVEHRRAAQRTVGSQQPHVGQRRQVVAFLRRKRGDQAKGVGVHKRIMHVCGAIYRCRA